MTLDCLEEDELMVDTSNFFALYLLLTKVR